MGLPDAYGSLRAGQRAAAVMSLIQSARMNGHDPYAYLKEVLTRLALRFRRSCASMNWRWGSHREVAAGKGAGGRGGAI